MGFTGGLRFRVCDKELTVSYVNEQVVRAINFMLAKRTIRTIRLDLSALQPEWHLGLTLDDARVTHPYSYNAAHHHDS